MQYFLDKVIKLKRLYAVDTNRSAYFDTGTASGYPANVQEPAPNKIQMYGGQIGNLWECYVEEDCPALETDQVIIDTIIYSIQNMKIMDFGSQHYKRLTIIKPGNNTENDQTAVSYTDIDIGAEENLYAWFKPDTDGYSDGDLVTKWTSSKDDVSSNDSNST